MMNQNVQTNRHGPQNKGCNQASADSKHYLVSKLRPSSASNDQSQGRDLVARSQLYKEQHNDPEILPLLERAFDEKQIDQYPVCSYVKNGIFLRKWRPADV